jgi:uncharacterized protein (DUF885 family)
MTDEARFYRQAEAWLDDILERNPVSATQLGNHQYDDQLADRTMEAMEEEYRAISAALHELRSFDTAQFKLDARIDHAIVSEILSSEIRGYEQVQPHLRSPGFYLGEIMGGVFGLIMKEFAPLPDRLQSALGRLRQAPRVLGEGMQNLVPRQVPAVWAETALEQARQAPGLFVGLLPAMAAGAAPELAPELGQAGQEAAQAIEAYAAFLQNQVLPQCAGDFSVGREYFDELLRERHMVDYDADELLATGWEQFRQTRAQMEALARQIDPNRTVQELLEEAKEDHPDAAGLLDAYRQAVAEIRQYVIDHEIATIPQGESLRVIETPEYLRPILPYAAYMSPGILEEQQEGIFIVTPVDPGQSAADQEQKLKGHYWAKLPITALHEAYPGHHLQLVWANSLETLPRRMGSFIATLFIEGWAFYCEELLEQMGYIAQPVQRLGRLSDQLWRAARIILDVSLHTRSMPVQEAVDFLVKECQLEPANALAEVRRYTQTPTQPQSYLMGKLAILDIVGEFRAARPELSMRDMHDAILGCGSLPPRLIRQQLGLSS